MADQNPPLIFMGQYHSQAMEAARATFESGAFGVIADLIGITVRALVVKAKGAPKVGADLMGLQGASAVFCALAKRPVDPVEASAWLMVTRGRVIGALCGPSDEARKAPAGSVLNETHKDWLMAWKIASADGLFRPDAKTKARRSKIKLNKAKARPAPEHMEANL